MSEQNSDQGVLRVGHVDESTLHDFIQGRLKDQSASQISEHLERCLVCRVWAARLRRANVAEASNSIISRLVEASPKIPANLHSSLLESESPQEMPSVGELWRVGRTESLVVWVRRVFEDSASVIPVTLDTELADSFSLIVPSEGSPLDLELVLIASVEGHVDLRAFLQRVGFLGLEEEVETLRQARKKGDVPPADFLVGPQIISQQDQRLEYRQVLSDLLADLSPSAFSEEQEGAEGLDVHSFLEELDEIRWRRSGIRIRELQLDPVSVDPAHELVLIAAVENLDLAILCSALIGAEPATVLSQPDVASACGQLLGRNQWADCVAVAIQDDDWSTVILPPPCSAAAIEAPSGQLIGPRVQSHPLPLVDALVKYLEMHGSDWGETEEISLEISGIDVIELGSAAASKAVEDLVAEGRRAHTEAKERAYIKFGEPEASVIAGLIAEVVREQASATEALTKFLGEFER